MPPISLLTAGTVITGMYAKANVVYIVVQSLFTDAQSFGMSGANVVQ